MTSNPTLLFTHLEDLFIIFHVTAPQIVIVSHKYTLHCGAFIIFVLFIGLWFVIVFSFKIILFRIIVLLIIILFMVFFGIGLQNSSLVDEIVF